MCVGAFRAGDVAQHGVGVGNTALQEPQKSFFFMCREIWIMKREGWETTLIHTSIESQNGLG